MSDLMKYEMVDHHFVKMYKCIPYSVCSKCGLLTLNNPFTRWFIKKGCDNRLHPEYNRALKGSI